MPSRGHILAVKSKKQLFGYEMIECLASSSSSEVYRVKKEGSEDSLLLTILKPFEPSRSKNARLNQAYQEITTLESEGVVSYVELVSNSDNATLIQEDFESVTAKGLLNEGVGISIELFLDIAIKVANTLGNLHREGIFHGDINSDNILIDLERREVKLTNFSFISDFTGESDAIYRTGGINRSLLYRSPEQTGRMNRSVDYRTDFYSFGITCYELLSAVTPFVSSDPMAIIHSHIAIMPNPPIQQNPKIPQVISDIVMKLMAKNVEDRYQSGFGVAADLKECQIQLLQAKKIKSFKLAQKDFSNHLVVPSVLLGREVESKKLITIFERVCITPDNQNNHSQQTEANIEVVLISGHPGVGKSALIDEMRKPVVERRGYFISGKYEQIKKAKPYSAIIQAFQGLVVQILTESDEKVRFWKNRLSMALGVNGKVISDVIPDIELIIGRQPDLIAIGPIETRNRFKFVFEQFVSALASERHPVVLCLDDIQWADLPSLELLKNIITSEYVNHLCVVGSYRDNDISVLSPVTEFIDAVEMAHIGVNFIRLKPLIVDDVRSFIEIILKCNPEQSSPLAELIHHKTLGNPFFVIQFLTILHAEELIVIDPLKGWVWDIDSIANLQVTDNVMDLLANKIGNLSCSESTVLKAGSAIGNRFDLETLSMVTDIQIDEVLKDLLRIIKEGLISYSHTRQLYIFNHDRIIETAYSLVTEQQKEVLHHRIGNRALKKATTAGELADNIFYIVDQLNLGINQMSDSHELDRLAELNLDAGIKAKESSAFSTALTYLEMAMDCLCSDSWDKQYDLTLIIVTELTECLYLAGDYDKMEAFIEKALVNIRFPLDKVDIICTRINARRSQEKFQGSIDAGLSMLRELGLNLTRKPNQLQVGVELLRAKVALRGRKPNDLLYLPKMTDPKAIASMKIIAKIMISAFAGDANQFGLIILVAVRFGLKHGVTPDHAFIFAGYGVVLSCGLKDYTGGIEYGELAMKLIEKHDARDQLPGTMFIVNGILVHWKLPLIDTIEPLQEGYLIGLETGNLEFAAFNLLMKDIHQLLLGKDISKMLIELSKNDQIIEKLNQKYLLTPHRLIWQDALNLAGRCDDPCVISGDAIEETTGLPIWLKENNQLALASLYFSRLSMQAIFNDYEASLENTIKFHKYRSSIQGSAIIRLANALDTVARIQLHSKVSFLKKIEYRFIIFINQMLYKHSSYHAPENTYHIYLGIEGLREWLINKNIEKAKLRFDAVYALLGKTEDTVIEALNMEFAALFYQSIGYRKTAEEHFHLAYNAYGRWGALGKQKQLVERYPEYFNGK